MLRSRPSCQSTVKPNICLPPDLWGEPLAKDKERALLFVWVSCSAVVPSTLVMIGLVGCFSPSQAIHWIWLMHWLVQSPLGFGGRAHTLWEGFNIYSTERGSLTISHNPRHSKHRVFISPGLFHKCLQLNCWGLRLGSCPVLKTPTVFSTFTVKSLLVQNLFPSCFHSDHKAQRDHKNSHFGSQFHLQMGL